MKFNRIRLSGFKSFVDPTELLIEDGLTGVVGPNGCGKSNLLEAIRWAMGENSAKSLRGAGMDDVIFSGTDRRPSRNLAEVTLALDNSDRGAPAQFNDSDDLEVTRRIERDSGSAYRINGSDVRAKDVQLLFADAATGAHSPALVSQGRVGALINAKPSKRRAILEEAAGITGLHARRKEAESRLRAAENNLDRLDDVMIQMDTQIASLRRQARQATRYKNISGDLRRAEATLLYLRWKSAGEAVMAAESAMREAEKNVAEATADVASLNTQYEIASNQLPDLRQAEAAAAAGFHRLKVARDSLEAERDRLQTQKRELAARLEQTTRDMTREQELLDDATADLKRLTEEAANLEAEKSGDAEGERRAAEVLEKAHSAASAAEEKLDNLSAEVAGVRARRESLASDLENLRRRENRLRDEIANAKQELRTLEGESDELKAIAAAAEALNKAESDLEAMQSALAQKEEARLEAQELRDQVRSELNAEKASLSGMDAEIKALEGLIQSHHAGDSEPVSASLDVTSGYETALGAALGDDLDAPESTEAPLAWRLYGPLEGAPQLPDSVTPLSDFVKGAEALGRRLSQIGVVDELEGDALAKDLLPGQRLVTKDGALWRWDGFVRRADVKSAAAIRLSQKNRLQDLKEQREKAEVIVSKAEQSLITHENDVDSAYAAERETRAQRTELDSVLQNARQGLTSAERRGSERGQRVAVLSERVARAKDDSAETSKRLEKAESEWQALPQSGSQEARLDELRGEVDDLRSALAEARAEYDSRHRAQSERGFRLQKIAADNEAWNTRAAGASGQLAELRERHDEIKTQIETLEGTPDEIEDKRKALLVQLEKAEVSRQQAADKLAEQEQIAREKDTALKAAQERMAGAREGRVRYQASVENAQERRENEAGLIRERFECAPAVVLDKAEVKKQDELPEMIDVERRLDRLKTERERMGAVNLRADVELQEIAEQLEHLTNEKNDLESAIARLRQAIGSLNREGRERMLAAFDKVNEHFSELFVGLFGGGQAHLELIESDDPLEAGLEIMAQPPGKKLQSLSLLSGGEQALTALSLIFAVFMTNPAPICVLDEVDAPLDDANVERFCNLLDNMMEKTDTRFIIVTHNAVTMSRMDRLFGVTMAERGVSQLVSVDLHTAAKMQARA